MTVRGGNGMCGRRAVMLCPAREQPGRRVENGHVERRKNTRAFACYPPQHGIDQARETHGLPVRLHQPDGQIDRGVIRHIEKENLRGADQQRAFHTRRLRRAAFEKAPKHVAERAEPAQHDGNQRPGQRAIAILETREVNGPFDEFVERTAAAQHAVENVRRDPAGRQACHFAGGSRWARRRLWPAHTFHCRGIPP